MITRLPGTIPAVMVVEGVGGVGIGSVICGGCVVGGSTVSGEERGKI